MYFVYRKQYNLTIACYRYELFECIIQSSQETCTDSFILNITDREPPVADPWTRQLSVRQLETLGLSTVKVMLQRLSTVQDPPATSSIQ
jgi:hypothetical protein